MAKPGLDEKAGLRRDTGWSNERVRPVSVGGDRNLHGAGNPREDDRDRRSAESGRTGETEYQLHCAAVDTIRRWILPGWIYTHIASGEKRD